MGGKYLMSLTPKPPPQKKQQRKASIHTLLLAVAAHAIHDVLGIGECCLSPPTSS